MNYQNLPFLISATLQLQVLRLRKLEIYSVEIAFEVFEQIRVSLLGYSGIEIINRRTVYYCQKIIYKHFYDTVLLCCAHRHELILKQQFFLEKISWWSLTKKLALKTV